MSGRPSWPVSPRERVSSDGGVAIRSVRLWSSCSPSTVEGAFDNHPGGVTFSRTFFRVAAVCSFLSAITTLGLIFLPRLYQPVASFDERMALIDNAAYLTRSWVYLVHPFITVAASLAVAVRQRYRAAGAATVGLLGILLWGGTEAAQQALTKVALDRTWRAAWLTADEVERTLIRSQVATYDAIWDAMYFLIIIAFLIGNVFLALAMRGERGLGRWVSIAYWGGAAVTLPLVLQELGAPGLPEPLDTWLYPAIQPLGRSLIGLWLWRVARAGDAAPSPAAMGVRPSGFA